MSLLLCFFIILYSASNRDESKKSAIEESLKKTFDPNSILDMTGIAEKHAIETPSTEVEVAMSSEKDIPSIALTKDKIQDAINKANDKALKQKNLTSELKEALNSLEASMQPGELNTIVEFILPEDTLFQTGSYQVTGRSKQQVEKIGKKLNAISPEAEVVVVGHTDGAKIGKGFSLPNNFALSSARAGAVAEVLIQSGVNRNQIRIQGMGSLQPLHSESVTDPAKLRENRKKNRRIHIQIISPGEN